MRDVHRLVSFLVDKFDVQATCVFTRSDVYLTLPVFDTCRQATDFQRTIIMQRVLEALQKMFDTNKIQSHSMIFS